ncbi:hypothetical protein PIROE2DRAFT_65505 [Piromyces sp. E2]|nr:hypothetical protein PIROE2DRAFT_65505 [Piromyces sp. E2]|eukprot:OUM56493.1 hypothetical protein PIROE2DRAFT_65505 [Piromyces sp. E2]
MKTLQLILIYVFAMVTASAYYISRLAYTIPETRCTKGTDKEILKCLDEHHKYSDVIVSLPSDKTKYFLYYESGWFNKEHRVTFKDCKFIYNFFNTKHDNNNKYPPRIHCEESNDKKYPEIIINLDITTANKNFSLDHFVVSKLSNMRLSKDNSIENTNQICDANKQDIGATTKYFYFDVEGYEYKKEGDEYIKVDKLVSYSGIYARFQYSDLTGCKKK